MKISPLIILHTTSSSCVLGPQQISTRTRGPAWYPQIVVVLVLKYFYSKFRVSIYQVSLLQEHFISVYKDKARNSYRRECRLSKQHCHRNSPTTPSGCIVSALDELNILAKRSTIRRFSLVWSDSNSKCISTRPIQRKFRS